LSVSTTRLEEKTDELAGLLEQVARADVAYRLASAKALLQVDGDTVPERDAQATLEVAAELTERKASEAIAEAAKESVRSLRDQLRAMQSLNANIRYSAGLELP
jgi:hypothetical protein